MAPPGGQQGPLDYRGELAMKRVFIVGNGISQEAGIPFAGTLLNYWRPPKKFWYLRHTTATLYPGFNPVYGWPDVEELLEQLQSLYFVKKVLQPTFYKKKSRTEIGFALRDLKEFLLDKFWEHTPRKTDFRAKMPALC